MKYEIEYTSEEIPESKPGRRFKFPFDKLEIGMSFIIKGMDKNTLGAYKAYAEKRLGKKFRTKTLEEGRGIAVCRTM